MKKWRIPLLLTLAVFIAACVHYTSETERNTKKLPSEKVETIDENETATGEEENQAPNDIATKGEAAPRFSLEGLDGKTYSLEDFKGKFVMLDFFTTHCAYCTDELFTLEEIGKTEKELTIVHISIGDSKKALESYRDKHHITHVILMDQDGSVALKYAAYGTPTHSFIDRDGNFIGNLSGALSEEGWKNARPYVFGE